MTALWAINSLHTSSFTNLASKIKGKFSITNTSLRYQSVIIDNEGDTPIHPLKLMPRNDIERIREMIRLHLYDMSAHAMEEMAEDLLTILDVEEAILTGEIRRIEKDDPRGTKYVVTGTAQDQQTPVGVVGRFASIGRYLIITVYEVTELED